MEQELSKKEAMDRLLRVWEANPELRLGQLMHKATYKVNCAYLFDDELVNLFELYLPKKKSRSKCES